MRRATYGVSLRLQKTGCDSSPPRCDWVLPYAILFTGRVENPKPSRSAKADPYHYFDWNGCAEREGFCCLLSSSSPRKSLVTQALGTEVSTETCPAITSLLLSL